MSIPTSFVPAKWHGTLPADSSGNVGISFEIGSGDVTRLSLSAACVAHVRETLGSAQLRVEQQKGNCMTTLSTYAELQFRHRLLKVNFELIDLAQKAPPEVSSALQQAESILASLLQEQSANLPPSLREPGQGTSQTYAPDKSAPHLSR